MTATFRKLLNIPDKHRRTNWHSHKHTYNREEYTEPKALLFNVQQTMQILISLKKLVKMSLQKNFSPVQFKFQILRSSRQRYSKACYNGLKILWISYEFRQLRVGRVIEMNDSEWVWHKSRQKLKFDLNRYQFGVWEFDLVWTSSIHLYL